MHMYAYSFVHVVVSRKKSTNFSLGKVYIAIYIILTYTYVYNHVYVQVWMHVISNCT